MSHLMVVGRVCPLSSCSLTKEDSTGEVEELLDLASDLGACGGLVAHHATGDAHEAVHKADRSGLVLPIGKVCL